MLKNAELWTSYKENKDQEARKSLILSYLNLVKYQANRINMFVPDSIEKGDLESYGVLGLMDAIEKFEPERGNKFASYAQLRIRGAIIDHLRKMDWLPHSLRRKGKTIKRKEEELKRKLGHKPDMDLLAEELNMSKKEIEDTQSKILESKWLSLYTDTGDLKIIDFLADSEDVKPENIYQKEIITELLADAIDSLNKQEKLVIALYYYEELTQSEIAEILEVSQARVSQIHKNAVYRLRGFLSNKKEQFV